MGGVSDMKILRQSGDVSVRISMQDGLQSHMTVNSKMNSAHVHITPVRAALMIEALREYLDALGDAAPVDYVKPIAE